MKRLAAGIAALCFCLCASGQEIDSLWTNYQNAGGRARVAAANELLETLERGRYASNISRFADDADAAAIEVAATTWMANYTFLRERYRETIELMGRVEELSQARGDSVSLERAFYLMGFAWQRLGDAGKAMELSTRSYELCKAMGNDERLSSVINNIANIYQTNDQDSIAIGFYRESIDIERRLGRAQQLSTRLGNLSTSYMKQGRLDEALEVVSEALELDRAGVRPDKTAARLTQLADVYRAMERYDEAIACLKEAYGWFDEAKSLYGMAVSLNMLGELEQLCGSPAAADDYFDRAATLAERNGNRYVYQKIAQNIYLVNRERNPARALRYYEQSVAIRDSIFGDETQATIAEFQVRYDTQGKELEIVRQQAEIKQQESRLWMLIGGLETAGVLLALSVWIVVLRTRRNRALAEMNATKDKFFSIISHDLKNPAIAQRNALGLLASHVGEWDTETLAAYSGELLKSADGQVELLYNLLNWAQVQTGRMPYRPVRFDLVAGLRSELDLVRSMASRKGVALEVKMPDAAVVTGDSNMIATVVRNLLANAVKFTPAGGMITLGIEPTNGSWTVSVADTGIGMTEEQLRDLFRLDSHRSRIGTAGEEGSGLGLVVSRELIGKHGSELRIESAPGRGSRFSFTLF